MRTGTLMAALVAVCFTAQANAAPVINLTPDAFVVEFAKLAQELAEGGMTVPSVECNPDNTECSGKYGSGNFVIATSPNAGAMVETVTVRQVLPGETADFWLTVEMVIDLVDPTYESGAERAAQVMGAIRNAPSQFDGPQATYAFTIEDSKYEMTARAR